MLVLMAMVIAVVVEMVKMNSGVIVGMEIDKCVVAVQAMMAVLMLVFM